MSYTSIEIANWRRMLRMQENTMTPKKWSWPLHTGRSLYEAQMQAQLSNTAEKEKTMQDQDNRDATLEVALEKMHDAYTTPGLEVPFDPDEAELVGAFEEDALSHDDAIEGAIDLLDVRETVQP